MERAWSLFQSSEVVQGGEGHGAASSAGHCVGDSGGNTPRDNDVVDVHAAGEQGKCAKGKETPGKTSKAKDNKAKDGSEHGEDAGDKKILASKFAQATKLKTTFLQLTSKAITVREQIEANPEWLWAKDEATLGRLISFPQGVEKRVGGVRQPLHHGACVVVAPRHDQGAADGRARGLHASGGAAVPAPEVRGRTAGDARCEGRLARRRGRLTRRRGSDPAQRDLLA